MRFGLWLSVTVLAVVAVVYATPAGAQNAHFEGDQAGMISSIAEQITPEPYRRPSNWIDVGLSSPVGTFKDRAWSNGFTLRWTHEFLQKNDWALVSSLGAMWNNNTTFNEAQVDQNFSQAFDPLGPLESLNHLSVPYTAELQFEPGANKNSSIILAAGGALNWTRESRTNQVATQIDSGTVSGLPLGRRDFDIDPPTSALAANSQFNRTKFHLGYVVRAGFRSKLTDGPKPLNGRLMVGWNVWYERSKPVSLITATLSFGR